jgi:hypothetical protein
MLSEIGIGFPQKKTARLLAQTGGCFAIGI